MTMLILTRRIGESLVIGDDVRMTVLDVKGNQVRIGVHAPKEVSVHREEVYAQIQAEQGRPLGIRQGDPNISVAELFALQNASCLGVADRLLG